MDRPTDPAPDGPEDAGSGSAPPVSVIVALGSNLGDRLGHLAAGIARLTPQVAWRATSSVYETTPVGGPDQPPFLNAVASGTTRLPAAHLLMRFHEVERAAGRVRGAPGGPRPLDLDLIFYGDQVISTEDLVVPHPRWARRGFVVIPLLEIAAERIDPQTGTPVRALVGERASAGVRWFTDASVLERSF